MTPYFNVEVTPESAFQRVSAAWSHDYTRFSCFSRSHTRHLCGSPSLNLGFVLGRASTLSFSCATVDKKGPRLSFFKNLHKTPQSKQFDHACFSRSNDVTKTLPFPLASKHKT